MSAKSETSPLGGARLKAQIHRSNDLWMTGGEFRLLRKAAGFSRPQLADEMRKKGWEWYEKRIKRFEKKAKVFLDPAEMQALLAVLGASSL